MNILEEATKLGNERYNRDKLLAITSGLITRFRPALRAGYPPEFMPRASLGGICPPDGCGSGVDRGHHPGSIRWLRRQIE